MKFFVFITLWSWDLNSLVLFWVAFKVAFQKILLHSIQKPVIWYAQQIKGPVSICNATPAELGELLTLLFHDGGRYHIEIYMITASVMKELMPENTWFKVQYCKVHVAFT